ncbi:DUF2339 domain-containing protein [Haloferula sp. A504]|uniref:DUF2339 domain-containing protein n=1 Tax=Haloferula sp. A504 TaxID=3373601 RepID=UPI0031BD350B|nr:DUF2339 domain-containing protein [Verrucomicrobiaceae bacterium E54]
MEEPRMPSLQLAKLQRKLDETAARQAEEIAGLREEIRLLEKALGPKPPPLPQPESAGEAEPKKPVANPVVQEEVPPRSFKESPTPPDRYPKPARTRDLPPPEKPPAAKPAVDRGRLEMDLGRVWLVRIGVVLLVTGLVLLGNYAYRNWIRDLPAIARLGFLVLSALAIAGAGWWCTRQEKLRAFGEVVLAGGMAFFYWCAYAAHHVERLRVLDSVVAGTLALLGAAAAIVVVSVVRNARTTAVMGLLLASYSTMLQPMSALTATSNVLLAATGVTLVALKRWRGPGFASMLGAYGAFLFWQLTGAVGSGSAASALGFVGVIWAVFAVPTLGAMQGLDGRGRAWWTGLNNGAGFGLFALLWWQAGWEAFWGVAAVWGTVWLALGAWGRRRSASSETYLVQGLLALSLALVLKLEGYHLGFGLALESLVLAGAFRRFRKWPELVFSVLAMIGATGWVVVRPDLPVWSVAVVAALPAGASFVLRRSGATGELAKAGRLAAGLGVVCAAAAGLVWCSRLPVDWRPLMAALAAGLLGWRVIGREARRRMPEVFGAGLVMALAGLVFLLDGRPAAWSLWLVAGLFGAAAWLWERHGDPATAEDRDDWRLTASVAVWLHAVGAVIALGVWLVDLDPGSLRFWIRLGFALGLPVLAWRVLGCPRLRAASVALLGLPLMDVIDGTGPAWVALAVPLAAWAVWVLCGIHESFTRPGAGVHAVLSRSAGALGWMLAWHAIAPEIWGDIIALSVLAGWWIWRSWLSAVKPLELAAWGLVAATMFLANLPLIDAQGIPSGWGVSATLVAAVFIRRRGTWPRAGMALGWSAVLVPTLWAGLWLLQHYSLASLTILLTLLGFAWVTVGLWRGDAAVRMGGFALLLVSLVKLFVHDVWRFDTFTRVAAFLALGVALVVLGFFYNRFAELLKRLVSDDSEKGG